MYLNSCNLSSITCFLVFISSPDAKGYPLHPHAKEPAGSKKLHHLAAKKGLRFAPHIFPPPATIAKEGDGTPEGAVDQRQTSYNIFDFLGKLSIFCYSSCILGESGRSATPHLSISELRAFKFFIPIILVKICPLTSKKLMVTVGSPE